MRNIPREAAELCDGLQFGLRSVADAVAWADEVIAELEHPPTPFIEWAMMSQANPHDVLSVLTNLSEGTRPGASLVAVLGLAYRRMLETPTTGAS